MPIKRPPLGLKPRKHHELDRTQDIIDAIRRYMEKDMPIPIEWIEEYNELVGRNEQ